MKKMKVLFGAVLILSVLLVTQIPCYAQRPAVDGFIGVPWGASKVQVQAAMSKKDFALIERRTDGHLDIYKGTFAGHPAELTFLYQKNVFYSGWAELLDVPSSRDILLFVTYPEMKQLFKAKYGLYNFEEYSPDSSGKVISKFCTWKDLSSTITPPGNVEINIEAYFLKEGNVMRITYSIGKSWALLKSSKGNDF